LADYVLARLNRLLKGLVVRPEIMRENMERSFGLYFSQRVLTALIARDLPRQKAYEAVQRLAMRSWETRRSFPELVRGDPDISGLLGRETLDEIFDPNFYLKSEDAIFARVFADGVGDC
nr:adenylosuccinate lyase [Desulfovibrio sp.]